MACPASEKPSRAWIITGRLPAAEDSCGAGNSSSYIPVCSGWYCCSGLSALSAIASPPGTSVAHFAVDAIAAHHLFEQHTADVAFQLGARNRKHLNQAC